MSIQFIIFKNNASRIYSGPVDLMIDVHGMLSMQCSPHIGHYWGMETLSLLEGWSLMRGLFNTIIHGLW